MLSLRHFSLPTATLMLSLVFPVVPTDIRLNLNASATPIGSTWGQLISRSLIDSSGQGSVLQDEQNQPENQKAEADRLFQEGIQLYRQRKYQESLPKFQQVIAIRKQLSDKQGEAITLHKIGSVYLRLSQYQQSLIYYRQALSIRREIGDRAGEAHTLNNMGAVYQRLNQSMQAENFFRLANAIYKEIGDRQGEQITLNNLRVFSRLFTNTPSRMFRNTPSGTMLRDDDEVQSTTNHSQPNTPRRVGNSSGEGSLLPDNGESAF